MAVFKSRAIRVICAAFLFLAAGTAEASTIIYRTDAELVALSDRVVHARVVRQRVERPDGPDGAIYTVTTLAVLEDFTGVAGIEVEAWELGGTIGDETMWVGGGVTYDLGSTVLVFLERGRFGYRSVAMGFSQFDVESTPTADGSLDGRLRRRLAGVSVVGGPAARRTELSLAEFRALTARVRGVTPRRNREAQLIASQSDVTSSFTFLGPFRWTEADSGTPVNWYLNTSAPSPLTSGDGIAELQLALQAWTAPSSASIILQFVGTTNQSVAKGPWSGISSSGTGVVTFEDPNNEISGSTLAIGGGSAFSTGGGTVNGQSFGRFSRGYVIWQNAANLSASFRETTNFARVMEHEIGHTIGLGHSEAGVSNIMHPSCCSSSTPIAPSLGSDDLAGLNFIYPSSAPPPPPPPTCSYSISPTSASAAAAGGPGSVNVTAGAGCSWTAIAPTGSILTVTSGSSGSGNGTVSYSVALNPTTSSRSGTLMIAGQTFNVTQDAAACSYTLSATSATFGLPGGSGSVSVTTNGTNCAWTASTPDSFLGITSGSSVTGSGTVSYTVAAHSAVSFRTGTITVAGQSYSVMQNGSGPAMSLDKPTLNYGAVISGGFLAQTLSQTVRLSQSGPGTVSWTATPSVPWITVSPTSGTGAATLTVSIAYNNFLPGAGNIVGSVALSFNGAGVSSGPLTVGLALFPPGSPAAASGALDTPADGITGVTGSIGITGWAIDDIEVRQVRIVRDPVAGEPAGLVHIGTAVFVDGARPDVAALYPTSPRRTRGGWGYLMLTNFLPNLGTGTFRIHAYADDADGHSTLLGSRTITCTNSTATAPFGAIDTPDQGATASGSAYANFGWVLSRGPALAYPPNGTVTVLIDGVSVGSPGGWTSRADLTALFPAATYPGVTNALGAAIINTTSLSNGLHTIAWVVTASNGQAAGIGSRFFTVQNAVAPVEEAMVAVSDVDAAPQDRSPIEGRRGYDLSAPFRTHVVGVTDRTTIYGEEMDRFELALGRPAANTSLSGFMRTPEGLAPLPPGSQLNPDTGVFTWQPGVGFVHAYDFVFVRRSNGQAQSRQEVRIVLSPKGSNRVGPQVTIDLPAANAEASGSFVIGGWAIDPRADAGTGIDAIHVWAYPADGGDPLFVGVAAYGGARPDVAAIYGTQFRGSGYGLIADRLPPGDYDLAVFAWSTVAGDFAPASVVRITVR